MLDFLITAFDGPGAGFMWAITALLAYGLAVVLERTFMLMFRFNIDVGKIISSIQSGNTVHAADHAASSPLGTVLRAGIGHPDPAAAWEAMGAVAAREEDRISGRIPYLATIGNVATMLGLLGTVYGLILAFGALGDTSAGERAVRLSEGISTAMATTAFGLMVGIPSLLAHAWLQRKARSLLADIEAAAGTLVTTIRKERGSQD